MMILFETQENHRKALVNPRDRIFNQLTQQPHFTTPPHIASQLPSSTLSIPSAPSGTVCGNGAIMASDAFITRHSICTHSAHAAAAGTGESGVRYSSGYNEFL